MSICHTLTGVWVEILLILPFFYLQSHTLTGVWVEIDEAKAAMIDLDGHTLTGVWVEIYLYLYKY